MSKTEYTNDGGVTETSVTDSFDSDDVAAFADLSGDHNPLHLDAEYAAETRFGEPIVHGALVTSLISAALAEFPGTVIFAEQTTEFRQPVFPGEVLTATATVTNAVGPFTELVTSVENEQSELVVTGTAKIMID
jgi:acyl dehydratase